MQFSALLLLRVRKHRYLSVCEKYGVFGTE